MTLTYLGPTVGAGGLIVPAAGDALDPLLAEAVLLLRASSLTSDWEPGDGWPNEGTLGDTHDAIQDGGPDQVSAAWVEGGVEMGDETNNGYSTGEYGLAFPVSGFDFSGDFTVALDFTPDVVPQNALLYIDMQDNILGQAGGVGWSLGDITEFTGGNTALIDDNEGATFPTDWNGIIWPTSSGRQLWVMRVDRTEGMQLFKDGTNPGTPAGGGSAGDPADLTGIGDVTPATGPGRLGPAQIVHNVAIWERALTDTEITVDLPAAL